METEKYIPPEARETQSIDSEIGTPEKLTELLDAILEAKQQPHFRFSIEEQFALAQKVEKKVEALSGYDEALRRLLLLYGCNAEVRRAGKDLLALTADYEDQFDKLPEGYAYKGGVARSILHHALDIRSLPVRDIDIARVSREDFQQLDRPLALKYSPEDLEHGHGVEAIGVDYFESRDFTINEVVVYGDDIYLTKACLLDTLRRIIRFSDQQKSLSDKGAHVSDKLMAKAIRFVAESVQLGLEAELEDGVVCDYEGIQPFHIALHLDRGFERGEDVADEYALMLVDLGQLPGHIQSGRDAYLYLTQEMRTNFVFRFAPAEISGQDEEDTLDNLELLGDQCDDLPVRAPMRKRL